MIEGPWKTHVVTGVVTYVVTLVMTFAALLAGSAAAAAAQTDPVGTGWDAFEARCMAPMSEIEQPDTAGLSEGGSAWMAQLMDGEIATAATYLVRDGVFLTVVPEGNGEYLGCSVIDESDTAAESFAQYETWMARETALGRWRETDALLGVVHRSTTWREPQLRFGHIKGNDGDRRLFVLFVAATDLES
ncbi:MAG: hypothetical protein WBA25_14875 [Jannaschia sp.]